MYIVHVEGHNLVRLINSWLNPGSNQRRIKEGIILRKIAPKVLLFSDSFEALRLIVTLKRKHGDNVEVFKAEAIDVMQLIEHSKTFATELAAVF